MGKSWRKNIVDNINLIRYKQMKVRMDKKRLEEILEGNKVAESVAKGKRKRRLPSGGNRLKFTERPGFMRACPEINKVREFQERGYTVVTNDPDADLSQDRAELGSSMGGTIQKILEYRDGEPVIGILMETPIENYQAEQNLMDAKRPFGVTKEIETVDDPREMVKTFAVSSSSSGGEILKE